MQLVLLVGFPGRFEMDYKPGPSLTVLREAQNR